MDTDALEEEDQELQSPPSPAKRIKEIPTSAMKLYPKPTPPIIVTPSKRLPEITPTTMRRSPGRGEFRKRKITPDLTPSETPHRSLESPDQTKAIQAAAELLLLGKTDSGKTTDISESTTTTTDDYVTANSDSSRRSHGTSTQSTHGSQTGTQDGSSFESASSIYSLARGEAICEDFIIPASFSPPPILEETDVPLTPIEVTKAPSKEPSSPDGDEGESSSSCGSYSIRGSSGDIIRNRKTTKPTVPSSKKSKTPPPPPSVPPKVESDDSSSEHYESPGDETYIEENKRHRIRRDRKEWSEEEKRRRKKLFTLEFSEDRIEDGKKRSPNGLAVEEKVKRTKSRSPQRATRKATMVYPTTTTTTSKKQDKEPTTPGMDQL